MRGRKKKANNEKKVAIWVWVGVAIMTIMYLLFRLLG